MDVKPKRNKKIFGEYFAGIIIFLAQFFVIELATRMFIQCVFRSQKTRLNEEKRRKKKTNWKNMRKFSYNFIELNDAVMYM